MTFTCDTSVLVPALASWHTEHAAARAALDDRDVTAVPAHVLLECFSALTRMPHDRRVPPTIAAAAIRALDLTPLTLPGPAYSDIVARLADRGIGGGAVCDGLIGATAAHHELTLLTRDRRAQRTYDAVGIGYSLVTG